LEGGKVGKDNRGGDERRLDDSQEVRGEGKGGRVESNAEEKERGGKKELTGRSVRAADRWSPEWGQKGRYRTNSCIDKNGGSSHNKRIDRRKHEQPCNDTNNTTTNTHTHTIDRSRRGMIGEEERWAMTTEGEIKGGLITVKRGGGKVKGPE